MSYMKSNLSMSTAMSAIPSSSSPGPSTSRGPPRDDPYGMSRLISNIMDVMGAPPSLNATPTSHLNGILPSSSGLNGPSSSSGFNSNTNATLAPTSSSLKVTSTSALNATPTSSLNATPTPNNFNDWGRAIVSTTTAASQIPIGPLNREYSHNNNHHNRDDSNGSPATSSTISLTCLRCEERTSTTRCLECNDISCHECCHNATSDCQLNDHTLIPIQQISPIGTKFTNSSTNNEKDFQCEIHSETFKYICESCTQLICQECTHWVHKDHTLLIIRGTFDSCRLQMMRAIESGKTGTKAIKSAIDRAVTITKSYERNSVEVSSKIRRTIRVFVQALEERERDLLERVERLKQSKLSELSDQMNTLRGILAGLAHTNECLIKGMELEGVDLFMAKEKRMAEIEYFATMYKSLQPREDTIVFMQPNMDLAEQIKTQGDVMLGSSMSAQTHRSMQYPMQMSATNNHASMSDYSGPASSRNAYGINSSVSNNTSMDNFPQRGFGQAILGYNYPINVKYTVNPIYAGMPLLSFGPEGQVEGEVSRPWGLCVNRDGNILVADRRNNRIQVFNRNGDFLSTFGSKGTGPGEFDLPAGITTDYSGRIIIIDKDNHRVQIFTSTGDYLFMFGSFGKDCGQFQYPWDVAVNSIGNIAVTDTRNHRIQLFTSRGTFITKFVFEGINPTKHLKGPTTPRGICFTTNGNILISDFENHRLLMLDSSMTRVITAVGREGCGINELNRPSGIVTDDEGRLIVADSKNHRVVVFSPDLRYEWSVDLKSPGLDDKDRPSDVALTPDGHIVVLFETLPDTARENASLGKEYIKMY